MAWRREQTYGQDLRERVLAARDLTARQAAARFDVSVSYVVKARQRLVRAGSTAPRLQRPPVAHKLLPYHAASQARVDEELDATLAEHREWLAETHGVLAGLRTLWKTLKELKLTRAPRGRAGAARCRCGANGLSGAAPNSTGQMAQP